MSSVSTRALVMGGLIALTFGASRASAGESAWAWREAGAGKPATQMGVGPRQVATAGTVELPE